MSDSLISIIVPVYNSEQTLNRCIDSILGQTYRNFELLLINDGSKDHSGEICDEYARKDSRVKVFHKENGGVSSARNVGLMFSKGNRVTFVDSDDSSMPRALEVMNSIDCDLVIMRAISVPEQNLIQTNWVNMHVYGKDLGDFILQNINSPLLNAPWGKLYNRRVILEHHLAFDEKLYLGEDSIFVKEYLMIINNIGLVNYIGYEYYYDGMIYKKYSKHFESIYAFYQRTITVNHALGARVSREIPINNTINVVYNIISEYIKTCSFFDQSLILIKSLLNDEYVRMYVKECNSVGARILLFIGCRFPRVALPLYGRLLKFCKQK